MELTMWLNCFYYCLLINVQRYYSLMLIKLKQSPTLMKPRSQLSTFLPWAHAARTSAGTTPTSAMTARGTGTASVLAACILAAKQVQAV